MFFHPSEADEFKIAIISLQIPCPFIESKHAWLDVKQTVSSDQNQAKLEESEWPSGGGVATVSMYCQSQTTASNFYVQE